MRKESVQEVAMEEVQWSGTSVEKERENNLETYFVAV